LLNALRKVKEVISQQFERKIISITPFQQKSVKTGYCYFCDVNIASGFAYELKKEEQVVFGIRVAQGAKFCSRECLEEYCSEYKKWDKLQQEKKGKIKDKIAEDRRLLTESEIRVANLRSKVVETEKKS